jgi:ribulose bisphosphate carboxylase small subunit
MKAIKVVILMNHKHCYLRLKGFLEKMQMKILKQIIRIIS